MGTESQDAASQANRIFVMVSSIMASLYPSLDHSIEFDASKNRIVIKVLNAIPIELSPEEWSVNNDELKDLIKAKLYNVIRARLP